MDILQTKLIITGIENNNYNNNSKQLTTKRLGVKGRTVKKSLLTMWSVIYNGSQIKICNLEKEGGGL